MIGRRATGAGRTLPIARLLVVKLADIGDAVLATGAIQALRDAYPEARIDALAAPSGARVLRLCPALDEVIEFPKHLFDRPSGLARPRPALQVLRLALRLRRGSYDAVVLLHHLTTAFGARKFGWLCRASGAPIRAGLDNGRGRFLTHRAIDFGFGVRGELEYAGDVVATLGASPDLGPSIRVADDDRRAAERLLSEAGQSGPFVAIHPTVGGFGPARSWPLDRFIALCRDLTLHTDLQVVIVGGPDATEAARAIVEQSPAVDLAARTSIPQLAAVLQRAELVIGADSGVVHLAAAVGAPVLAIFGPSNLDAWRPFGAGRVGVGTNLPAGTTSVALTAGLPCSPCFYTGFTLGRPHGCGTPTCLDMVRAEDVLRLALQLRDR